MQGLGYEVHTPIEELWDKARKIDVTNLNCGHRFQVRPGNILNGLSKCSVCGPRLRIQAALAAYIRRYGRTNYNLTKRKDYYKKVWQLTNKNFTGKRSRKVHLDHIISIDWGFKNQVPPQMIADPLNLRLLPARDNIVKRAMVENFTLLKILAEKYGVPLKITCGENENLATVQPAIVQPTTVQSEATQSEATQSEAAQRATYQRAISLLLRRLPNMFKSIDIARGTLQTPKQNIQIIDVDNPAPFLENHLIIFSDELINSSRSDRRLKVIVERLLHEEGRHNRRVSADECEVKQIDALRAGRFLDTYHLQGRDRAKVRLGLFHRDELVMVMTFARPKFNKDDPRPIEGCTWELNRCAAAGGITVESGTSKLLMHFRQRFPGAIMARLDRRWGDGKLYSTLGFTKVATTKPSSWWCKNGQRISSHLVQLGPFSISAQRGPQFQYGLRLGVDEAMAAGWTKVQDLGGEVFILP